jgi:predicted nuclease of predicted toxin-antitoxin system
VTKLFAKIYLDENMDIRLAALLRHRGFCATTAHAVELLRADDQTQLLYAATNGYCLVTHNLREFEVLHDSFLAAGQSHSGIIIASAKNVYRLVDHLAKLLNTPTADEIANQILYV